jgi:ISXO2-like transposase domain
VFAAVERGGRVKATVLPSRRGPGLQAQAIEWIDPRSIVYTDEWPTYSQLHQHFASHSRVRHAAGEYVIGDAYTNTIEGWFGNVKPSIKGTYRKVSHKWLQGYLNEFVWRYNAANSAAHRCSPNWSCRRQSRERAGRNRGATQGRCAPQSRRR